MCCFFFQYYVFWWMYLSTEVLHKSSWLHEVEASLSKFRTKSACFMVVCETVFELICHESCVTSGTNLDIKTCMPSQAWKVQKIFLFCFLFLVYVVLMHFTWTLLSCLLILDRKIFKKSKGGKKVIKMLYDLQRYLFLLEVKLSVINQ